MNNKKIIIVIVIVLLIGGIYPIYKVTNNRKKIESIVYSYEIKNNTILLMNEDKIVNFYNCDNECFVYNNYFNKNKVLIKEDGKIYLYDLLNNKKISKEYDNIYFLYNNNTIEYFLVEINSLYGIADLNGTETINPNYKELGSIKENIVSNYNIINDIISVNSENKYGILSISSGKGVIDFQYQDLYIIKNNILAKTEQGWTLINKQNLRIKENYYEEVIPYDKYFLAKNLNEIFVVSYNGDIISNKIDITNQEYNIIDGDELNIEIKDKNKKIVYKYQEKINEFIK